MSATQHYDARLTELIAHLYDAALDDALWLGTAERMARAFESSSAVVKLHGVADSVELLERTENLVVAPARESWAEDWHRRDLWVERSIVRGMSQIITGDDLVTAEEQAHSGYYQEWLSELDIHHMLGAVFPAVDGAVGVMGIHRPRAAERYGANDRRRAALLLPHLRRALQLGQRLSLSSVQNVALQALDQIAAGVIVLDGAGRVIHASGPAEAILQTNRELAVKGGRLWCRQPALNERLQSQIRDALETAAGRPAPAGAALAVAREGRAPLTLTVAPLRPSATGLGDQRPCALVFVREPDTALAIEPLCELFGLTPAEGAVAADLARGLSLDHIARLRGVRIATVRSHLKQILSKTGTHRQAELAALLARSA